MRFAMLKGDRVHLEGDAGSMGLTDYGCRVNSDAVLLENLDGGMQKVLVCIDYIDGDHNVFARVRVASIQLPINGKETA